MATEKKHSLVSAGRSTAFAVNDVFSNLFGADAVQAAFAADAQPSVKKNGCTVEQILKMKETGLTREQIEAACGTAH